MGYGKSGSTVAPTANAHAAEDDLVPPAVEIHELPLTPDKLLRVLRAAPQV